MNKHYFIETLDHHIETTEGQNNFVLNNFLVAEHDCITL